MQWVKTSRCFINLAAIARFEFDESMPIGRIIWLSGDAPMLVRGQDALEIVTEIEQSLEGRGFSPIVGESDELDWGTDDDYPPLVVDAIASESF